MPNLKAREFDAILRQHGVENGMVMICTHLLERINDLEAALTVNGQLMDKQTDLISNFATIAENMKHVIDGLTPKRD